MTSRQRFCALGLVGIALSQTTGCDSGPIRLAELVRGAVLECKPTAASVEARKAYWASQLQQPTYAYERPGWQEVSNRLPLRYPGVLVRLELKESAAIVLERTAGRAEAIRVLEWQKAESQEAWYFTSELGAECGLGSFEPDETLLAMEMAGGQGLPPSHIAPYLGVDQLSRAPKLFVNYWPVQ